MLKQKINLNHEFVEYIPSVLMPDKIYVSIPFATAAHKCCCGCGNEVVTPLSRTDWRLIFDGQSISLDPSIGNWSFDCKSHYWIRRNSIQWAPKWSSNEIKNGRAYDRLEKKSYFSDENSLSIDEVETGNKKLNERVTERGVWSKLKNYINLYS